MYERVAEQQRLAGRGKASVGVGPAGGPCKRNDIGVDLVFRHPLMLEFWASLWAERMTGSALAGQALQREVATLSELSAMAAGFQAWAAAHGGWMTLTRGELICRV
jgi:hypothetical protein